MYRTNSVSRIPLSISVMLDLSGSVSEYRVAANRKASSTECVRSSATPGHRDAGVEVALVLRVRCHAMNTTLVHPSPISSRFAPVMFASAREHGDATPGSPLGHDAP